MILNRRRVLIGAAGAVLCGVAPARATPAEVAALIRDLVGDGTLAAGRVKLDLPVLIENGNAVSMTVGVEDLSDPVVSLSVYAELNPLPHVITAIFGPAPAVPACRPASGLPRPRRSPLSPNAPTDGAGATVWICSSRSPPASNRNQQWPACW